VPLGGRHELDSKNTRKPVEADSGQVYELDGKAMQRELLSAAVIEDPKHSERALASCTLASLGECAREQLEECNISAF
jgi:hypothetical protein